MPSVITFLTVVLVIATGVFWLAAPEIIRFFLSASQWPGGGGGAGVGHDVVEVVHTAIIVYRSYYNYHCLLNARRDVCGSVAFSPVLANLVTIGALVVAEPAGHEVAL